VEDEKRADDDLGRRHVLAGEKPDEFSSGLEFVGRDRLAVELIELVHAGRDLRQLTHSALPERANNPSPPPSSSFCLFIHKKGFPCKQ